MSQIVDNKIHFLFQGNLESAVIHYSILQGHYLLTLLGGRYHNTHGQGRTIEQALQSLKIRLNQLTHQQK